MNEAPGALGTPPGRSVASPRERADTADIVRARRADCQRERLRRVSTADTARFTNRAALRSLLLDDFDLERNREGVMQLERDLYRAEALDGLRELHAPPIELHPDALERFLDVLARDGAPHAIFVARGAFDLHGDRTELRLELLGL